MPAISMSGAAYGFGKNSGTTNPTSPSAIMNIDMYASSQTVVNATTKTLSNRDPDYPTVTMNFTNGTYNSNNIGFIQSTPNTSSTWGYTNVNLDSYAIAGNWSETKEVWINVPSGVAGTNGTICTEQGNTTFTPGWFDSQIEIVNGNLLLGIWTGTLVSFTLATSIVRDKWHHVVWRYNTSTARLDGYYDGQKISGIAATRMNPVTGGSTNFNYLLGHGTVTNMGSGADYTGAIGVFRYYNQALTDTQIVASWNADRVKFGV